MPGSFVEPAVATTNASHDPIYINGDSNFTAANGVVGGSGTALDPFRIANWSINVTSWVTPAAIILTNTNASAIVESILVNVTAGDPEIGSPDAIRVVSAHNVMFREIISTGQNALARVMSSSNVSLVNSTALDPNPLGASLEVYVSQSQYVSIAGNNLSAGWDGLWVAASDHVDISSNQIAGALTGISVSSSSNVTFQGGTLFGAGLNAVTVQDFAVDGMEFRGGASVYIQDGRRVAVDDNLLNGGYVALNYTTDSRVERNANVQRIWLAYSPSWNTTIVGNEVLGGAYGIYGWSANDAVIEGNNVSGQSQYGIVFVYARNVTVVGNRVSDSAVGILVSLSSDIATFHNDFSHNTVQASVDRSTSLSWNASYPTGGNYWSDYTGVDQCSGPLQDNCTGPDGIGDTPYLVDSSNIDHYPLMASGGNDTTPPVVAITSPSEGASFSSSPISVSGTADDAGGSGIRDVQVRVNGGIWQPATGFATWNASVPLTLGANHIEAEARDWAGNAAIAAVNVTYAAPPPPSNTPPHANFSWTPSTGNTSTPFMFNSTSSDIQDPPSLLQVRWDWASDGTWDTPWSTNGTATHTFGTPGTYNVTTEVRDTGGLTGNKTYAIPVTPASPPPPPALEATIVASPVSGTMPLTVTFNSTVTGGVAPYACDWHLGDGSTSPAANTVHIYLTGGNFTVWLTVNDYAGSTVLSNVLWVNVTPAQVDLAVVPVPPTSFTADANGITVTLSASVSGGTPPYTFSWAFGDGSTSSGEHPVHTYARAGSYNVTLTVTDSRGVSVVRSFALIVPACPGCGLPGIVSPLFLAVIILGSAVAVAVVVYTFVRWRRPRPPAKPR